MALYFPKRLEKQWSLVTGASSGLGASFAMELAKEGSNLILVARRQKQLHQVEQSIKNKFPNLKVLSISADLALESERERIFNCIQNDFKIDVDVLVNNAGIATYGKNEQVSWQKQKNQIDLNVLAIVHLTKLFLESMICQKHGYIIQVGSITAFSSSPFYGIYCATKAFLLSYTESLHEELKGTGVNALCICPGAIDTEFFNNSGEKEKVSIKRNSVSPEFVASLSVDKMFGNGSASMIPDWTNSIVIFIFTTFFPRSFVTWLAGKITAGSQKEN